MIVAVDPASGTVELREPDVFTALHVEAGSAAPDAVLAALGPDGAPADDGHVLVSVEAVRRWAGPAADEAWEQGYAAMLDFAASKGWVAREGTMIRAHLA
jgi:hypothetical protein